MAFTWIYENTDGDRLGHSEPFDSRDEAETWLGENFPLLVDENVEQVRLMEDDVEVASAMSLFA